MQFESLKICRKTAHTVPVNLVNPIKTTKIHFYNSTKYASCFTFFFFNFNKQCTRLLKSELHEYLGWRVFNSVKRKLSMKTNRNET